MTVLNITTQQHYALNDLYAICNYVANSNSTRRDLIYGSNVSMFYPAEDMELVKKVFHQENGRACFHIVLSLEENDPINLSDFKMLSVRVCDLIANFYGNYQVLMAVHINTDNLHTHFASNNIDFTTGKRMDFNLAKLDEIKRQINNVLNEYNVSLIKVYDAPV
ncbi:relaxase/mobilization nuclease domain-containing protein [Dendrosporobacter sp. 1207_IL3150]|uniref:relaxase/mobilization nuclease domain-containing protein n=1 Tax=Dendrosporobacter sp. 1207_IL3150 TaxID=3084054 RepID=UPI002FDB3D5A